MRSVVLVFAFLLVPLLCASCFNPPSPPSVPLQVLNEIQQSATAAVGEYAGVEVDDREDFVNIDVTIKSSEGSNISYYYDKAEKSTAIILKDAVSVLAKYGIQKDVSVFTYADVGASLPVILGDRFYFNERKKYTEFDKGKY